jgi:hypothetical protein
VSQTWTAFLRSDGKPDALLLRHRACIPFEPKWVVTMAESFEVDGLYRWLRRALRYGLRASRLISRCPELVELLAPVARFPGQDPAERAIRAEELIQRAIGRIGGTAGEVLEVLLGLAAGTHACKLGDRRRQAASMLSLQPDTFRRPWREAALLHDLAVEIYRLYRSQDG